MTADPTGTPAERARAVMGWKPRAQILAEGGDITRRCERCRYRRLDRKRTRESATCKHWEL